MKTISTGTGLCALAGAVLLYPLLHRAEPQGGVINAAAAEPVSAATQSAMPKTQPPLMPTPPTLPPVGGGAMRPHDGGVAMQVGGEDCGIAITGEPLNWFTVAHPIEACTLQASNFLTERFNHGWGMPPPPVDLDRDGETDPLCLVAWLPPYTEPVSGNQYGGYYLWSSSGLVVSNNWIVPSLTVARYTTSWIGGNGQFDCQPVVSGEFLAQAVCQAVGCPAATPNCICNGEASISVFLGGFHDMDADGDLDLVVVVRFDQSLPIDWKYLWLENTVPSDPPLAADINEDGYVDGKDLAMVLSAWTP